jgi:septum site-determining protein MinC
MEHTKQGIPPVRVKGVGDSLWVTIDPSLPLERIKSELTRLFERLQHLAVNARVIIDPGGPEGFEDLIETLGKFLKEGFNVGLVSGPPQKRSFSEENIRQRDALRSWHHYRSDVLMLAGRVRSGQKVTARKHLLIMGDVNPGAEITAGCDILVLGSLCGIAAAGQPDREDSLIFSLDFRPTQIQIGGFVAAGPPSSQGKSAEFARIEEGRIVVENYLAANPFGRLPWPEVR